MNFRDIVESVTDSEGMSHEVVIATIANTPCGETVEISHICDKHPSCCNEDCVAGKNLLDEIL